MCAREPAAFRATMPRALWDAHRRTHGAPILRLQGRPSVTPDLTSIGRVAIGWRWRCSLVPGLSIPGGHHFLVVGLPA